jgi:hypothetical protein
VYEPTTVEIDRVCGEGNYRSYTIYFVGRLIQIVEAGHTTMRLYGWADLAACSTWSTSRRTNPVSLPDAPSTRSSTPTPAVARPVRDTPQRRCLGLTRNSPPEDLWVLPGISRQRGRDHTRTS